MTGPWRPGIHGQSLKLWIRSTCRRLKEIADQTAIGKIAYLLRKRDPMWARLHKGAVRQGLRSASAILAWMETNLQRAKTKTRLPTVVKLDTGNNFHSLDGIDDLKKVNLFDEKKIELDFKIEDNIAAAAFFTRYKVRVNSEIFFHFFSSDHFWPLMTSNDHLSSLPTLALYQWDLSSSACPERNPGVGCHDNRDDRDSIWIRKPNRNILIDLSMYDIFDSGMVMITSWWRHSDVTNIHIFIRQCCPGKITNKQEFHCIISPLYGYHSAFWYCTGKSI